VKNKTIMKIGIVNDTEMASQAISMTLGSGGEHRVLWTAGSGPEAIRLCGENLPDLVLMDLVMPGMNGAAATREIMRTSPTGILVVTASVAVNCALAFEAMGAGALDVIATPALGSREGRQQFLNKISQLASIITDHGRPHPPPTAPLSDVARHPQGASDKLVAIGCSAGGPAALAGILGEVGPLGRAAMVIVQHIDARFIEDLATWLKGFSKAPLQLAKEGEFIEPGCIYLAGKDGHVEAHSNSRLRYDPELRGLAYQPSVDVFFKCIARSWRGRAMGIVLTGMGRDGSSGLRAMREAGFLTIAQDEKSSAIFGMPKAAAPYAAEILPLAAMASRINRWIQSDQ
jgi:two-component system response regulator WspF